MSYITFIKQPLADGFLPILASASNGDFAGSSKANIYPDEFKYFAQRLSAYPREPGDQVMITSGGDGEAWESYLYLGVYLLESNPRPALEVRLRRNEPEEAAGGAAFIIPASIPLINSFGQALLAWLESPDDKFDFAF